MAVTLNHSVQYEPRDGAVQEAINSPNRACSLRSRTERFRVVARPGGQFAPIAARRPTVAIVYIPWHGAGLGREAR